MSASLPFPPLLDVANLAEMDKSAEEMGLPRRILLVFLSASSDDLMEGFAHQGADTGDALQTVLTAIDVTRKYQASMDVLMVQALQRVQTVADFLDQRGTPQ